MDHLNNEAALAQNECQLLPVRRIAQNSDNATKIISFQGFHNLPMHDKA